MRQPSFDEPLIELEAPDGRVIDLYNDYRLRTVVFCGDKLDFEFDAAHGFVAADSPPTALVQFVGVRGLSVSQPDDWELGEADQIEYLLIRRPGPWAQIAFWAGGLEYEFDCAEVRLAAERRKSNDVRQAAE